MIKKIFFQIVFFNFLFTEKVFAAESGGMPQLNPEFWVSQIFWLIITFGILYVVLSKLILPKISANLELRKLQILDNIEAADKQREESEIKLKEYDEVISRGKVEAKSIYNQARERALKDINAKREVLDKQIGEEVKKAEEEIKIFFSNGMLIANQKNLSIFYPRDTFNKTGNFIKPKKRVIKMFTNSWIEKSLQRSMDYFIKVSNSNKNFKLKDFYKFMKINEIIIKN